MSLKYWLSSRRNITSVPTDFPNVHDKIVLFSSVWIKLSRSLKLNSQRFLFIFARNFRCALFSIFRSLGFCVWIFNLLHRRLSHFVTHERFTYMLRLVCIFESVVDCCMWMDGWLVSWLAGWLTGWHVFVYICRFNTNMLYIYSVSVFLVLILWMRSSRKRGTQINIAVLKHVSMQQQHQHTYE